MLWLFDLVQLSDAHPAPLSLPLDNRRQGEYVMKKIMDGDRLEEKNHYQGQTRLDLGKTDVLSVRIELDSEKHRQIALMYNGGWEVY